jgi:hypothetical protein
MYNHLRQRLAAFMRERLGNQAKQEEEEEEEEDVGVAAATAKPASSSRRRLEEGPDSDSDSKNEAMSVEPHSSSSSSSSAAAAASSSDDSSMVAEDGDGLASVASSERSFLPAFDLGRLVVGYHYAGALLFPFLSLPIFPLLSVGPRFEFECIDRSHSLSPPRIN